MTIEQCRQCVDPPCVKQCPAQALIADARHGHVRMVDRKKCIGCGTCYEVCPYTPSRAVVEPVKKFKGDLKSRKCDLCVNARYQWDEQGSGEAGKAGNELGGKQACVAVCPVGAIVFTKEIPVQKGDDGYKVDLRGRNWGRLGYPTN